MLNKTKQSTEKDSNDSGILEQSFSQLAPQGRAHLISYLQNLVSIQKTMSEALFNGSPKKAKQ